MNKDAKSVARVYTLKRTKEGGETIQYIGCTLQKLDKKLLEHKTKEGDFFNKWSNERNWALDSVSIHPVCEFGCKHSYIEPYQFIPLNYDTNSEDDMVRFRNIVKHFVNRCIESMNK